MVRKCANPSCRNLFQYMQGGKVLLVDLSPHGVEEEAEFREGPQKLEYFWLCENCSPAMTVIADWDGTAVIQPMHQPVAQHGTHQAFVRK